MQFTPTNKKVSPKLKQFQTELNELLDSYQYILKPIISYNANGIVPIVQVLDKVPKKKNLQKKGEK